MSGPPLASLLLAAALALPAYAQPPAAPGGAPTQTAQTPESAEAVQRDLLAITRDLLDSVAAGKGREVWTRYLLPECLIADSTGQITSRDEVTAQFPTQPSPGGRLEVTNPTVRLNGDVAVLSYDLTEREEAYGQALVSRFHATDTYVRRGGGWKILSSQGTQLAGDPPAGRARPESYAALAGTYRIAPGVTTAVTREGDRLYAQRNGRAKEELLPETPDVFFRTGVPGRRIFDRDASGKVTRMIDRGPSGDLVWTRVEEAH